MPFPCVWPHQPGGRRDPWGIRFHHRLVQIHPFPNGNGRHARIMADMVLTRVYGEKPIDWAGGHDLQKMNERRAAYIAALNGRLRTNIGNVSTLDDAVAALNPTERRRGKTIIRIRP